MTRITLLLLVLTRSSVVLPTYSQPPTPAWTFNSGLIDARVTQSMLTPQIAVSDEGYIYAAAGYVAFPGETSLAALFALNNTNGSLRWSMKIPNAGLSGPVVGPDGTVYCSTLLYQPTFQGSLMAVTNGAKKWEFKVPATFGPPSISSDGTIWVAARTNLYGLRPNGATAYTFSLQNSSNLLTSFSGAVSIANDDTIYTGVSDGRFLALHADGTNITQLWQISTEPLSWSPSAIGADGCIYVGCAATRTNYFLGRVFAVNRDGSLRWEYRTGGLVTTSPAVGTVNGQDRVFVPCEDGKLYAINADGTLAWNFATDDSLSTPVLAQDGTIYCLGYLRRLYRFSAAGELVDSLALPGNPLGSTLSLSSRLYVGNGVQIIAYDTDVPLGAFPWPMLDHDQLHTSRSTGIPPVTSGEVPRIISASVATVVQQSRDLSLAMAAAGPGLSYQWRFNGLNLTNETNAILSLTNVSLAQEGVYSVAVSNAAGMVGSSPAQLTVLPSSNYFGAPLDLSGWNVDVIREAQYPSAAFAFSGLASFTLAPIDGSSWFETGYKAQTNGLPPSRKIVSALDTNVVFELQPYTSNNVLKLTVSNAVGTLTLSTSVALCTLSILAASTLSGGGMGQLRFTFTDGTTSDPLPFLAANWGTPGPRWVFGGISAVSHSSGTDTIYRDDTPGFGFHETDIDLSAFQLDRKPIKSITFTKPGLRGRPYITGIFALSGSPAALPPGLGVPRKTANNSLEIEILSPPTAYTIQSSTDLVRWNTAIGSVSADQLTFAEPFSTATKARFYRLQFKLE